MCLPCNRLSFRLNGSTPVIFDLHFVTGHQILLAQEVGCAHHCSYFSDLTVNVLAKGDKHSYLMCFVKLMNINGTTLADERHELVVYKVFTN